MTRTVQNSRNETTPCQISNVLDCNNETTDTHLPDNNVHHKDDHNQHDHLALAQTFHNLNVAGTQSLVRPDLVNVVQPKSFQSFSSLSM